MSILFDWDKGNIAHIAAHNVLQHEAEEVISNQPLYFDYSFRNGEERHSEVGETNTGRILFIVSTIRNERTRVVTAYEPDRSIRMTYLVFKESEYHGKENPS